MPSAARFEEIAEKYLDIKVRGSSELMTACPFCQGSTSLQFNIDTGLWICFRCDAKGNAKSLVKRIGGTYTDPVVSADAIYKQLDELKLKDKHAEPPKPLDEAYLKRFNFPDEYWEQRFSPEAIAKWQLGYDPIKDRNTIPYRDEEGNLLGVIQRLKDAEREREDVEIRYVYEKGFNRKESLFGSWVIKKQGLTESAVVEGSTDVVALDECSRPGLGQFGSSISQAQARLLVRLGLREVVLFYDYDEAGRKAEEKARQVIDGLILYRVVWDTSKYCWHKKLCGCGFHNWRTIANCNKKINCKCGRRHEMDPGNLPKKERRRMYDNAELVGRLREKSWRSHRFA